MNDILKQLEQFHGHLGPYAVIGYKMGVIAKQVLGSDPFDKEAVVCTGSQPPLSCVIDGVQIGSGCTLGKGNIKIKNLGEAKAEFTNKKGKKIEITLKSYIRNEIDSTVTESNITEYSKQLYEKPDDELFEIKT